MRRRRGSPAAWTDLPRSASPLSPIPRHDPMSDKKDSGRLADLEDEDLDRLPARERHGGRKSEAIDRRARRARERAPEAASAADGPAAPSASSDTAIEGTIVAITRGQCEV